MSELVYVLFYLGVLALVVGCLAYLFVTRFVSLRVDRYRRTVKNARVLICSLGESPLLAQEAEQDAEIYSRHFTTARVLKTEKLADLLLVLKSENFNILHLLNDFAEDGSFIEGHAIRAGITPLFDLCRAKKLLFVYLAGDIPEDRQAAVYKSTGAARVGHDFPLVITTDRGTEFSLFLDRLLHEIANGEFLGNAWLKVRPQDIGPGAPQPTVDSGPKAVVVL